MKSILAVCVLVATVVAQAPTPCKIPGLWESRLYEHDETLSFQADGKYSYDSIGKRERKIEEQIIGTNTEFVDVLRLYNQQIEYRFNLKTRNCVKNAITEPFRNFDVPSNATFYGQSYIGK